jgi:putative AlgH/UPF0301 family transcriptional regulator
MGDLSDPGASRVVLIGVSRYQLLPALPSVRGNVAALQDLLQNPELWGVPPENVHVLLDPDDPAAVSREVRKAATATGEAGLLLVYHAGHGLIDPDDGRLILGLPGCNPEVPHEGGVPYDWIRRAVATSAARRRVVILDCCYSGRASAEMSAATTGTDAVADLAESEGTCLLVSAPANRRASAPEGEPYTAFTGEVIRVLRDGPTGPGATATAPTVTVEEVWRDVRRAMSAKGYERPELRARNFGGSIPLVHNAASRRRDLAGSVLFAAPSLVDQDLGQGAVLVLRHNDTGAVGVRLTRPAGPIPADFPSVWRPLLRYPGMLFDGGPLARDGYIVVAMLRSSAATPLRFTAVRDRLGTIALSPLPEELGAAVDGMRVFVGYLGWRPGELEEYLDSGALLASPRSARQVFTERPRDLWRALQADR